MLAREGVERREIVLTDLTRGETVGLAQGYGSVVTAVTFKPNGRKLITATSDTVLLVWDVEALRQNLHKRRMSFASGELDELWDDLGGSDSRKAYRALWRMVEGQAETVRFLRGRLRPVPEGKPRSEKPLDTVSRMELLRELRAVEILELIGTADARDVVAALAKGAPGARLTHDAAATLARLTRRDGP